MHVHIWTGIGLGSLHFYAARRDRKKKEREREGRRDFCVAVTDPNPTDGSEF
jgi:hypothetical protein